MGMRLPHLTTAAILCLAPLMSGQIPDTDARNTNIRHTDYKFSMPKFATRADWEAHKAHLRRQILVASGLMPMPEKTPLHPEISGRIERKGYSIEKVALETMPGYYLGGNLYRPLHPNGKVPAILTPHGHWTYGRLENAEGFSGQALGISLALQGYVAFAYDMVGYNDTLQTEHAFSSPTYQLWNFGPLALQTWNSIRAVDFVESLPEVDGTRIGVTGASGGGTQTFLLAAVDDRISIAAPVNMVSFIMQGGCECENAPGLRAGTSNVEIASMMAPRPMLLVSATGDWTKNVPREEYPAVRSIYDLYDKPQNVEVVQFEAEHNYNKRSREAVYAFFAKHLLGSGQPAFQEGEIEVQPLLSMLIWQGRSLPAGAVNQDQLFEYWKNSGLKRVQALNSDQRRQLMLDTFHAEWPAHVLSSTRGEDVVLSREGRSDRVAGVWIKGKGPATLIIHPDGIEAARQDPKVKQLVAAGKSALLIDVFQTDGVTAARDLNVKFFLTFNASDDANRVQDILTALAYLDSQHSGKLSVLALGKAGAWASSAKAMAPVDVSLDADMATVPCSDEDYQKNLFVPGIRLVAKPCSGH
ncbi:MAG: acetylxylan esterase [Bryobacteraceae bacterium]